jgi:hypothetical protein
MDTRCENVAYTGRTISGLVPKVNSATSCIQFSGYTVTVQKNELLLIEKYYRLNRAEAPSKLTKKKKLPTD